MKKSLFALAVLGAFAGAAQAQSSVTLYGTLDMAVGTTSNTSATTGASFTGLYNSGMENSAWGLKGSEDMGGGLKTHFNLESAFTPSTGQANGSQGDASVNGNANGELFGRAANVGIAGGFGDVTVGRMLNPYIGAAFGGQSIYSNNFMVTSLAAGSGGGFGNINFFVNNAIKYDLPKFADISITAFYALGNSTSSSAGTTTVLSAEWSNSGFTLGGAYQKLNAGTGISVGSTGNSPVGTLVGALQPDETDYQFFAKYATGPFSIGANFLNSNASASVGGLGFVGSQNLIIASAGYQATPALNIALGYSTVSSSSKVDLLAKYALSKRTYLYAQVDSVNNSSSAAAAGSLGYSNYWDGTTPSSGAVNSTGFAAGVVTHF
jgi:predicted porin